MHRGPRWVVSSIAHHFMHVVWGGEIEQKSTQMARVGVVVLILLNLLNSSEIGFLV